MIFHFNLCGVLVLVSLSISAVSCLKCHVCSTGNAGQEDCLAIAEGNSNYLTECEAPHNESCRIQEQWVDFKVLNQTHEKRTIRQCASIKFEPGRPWPCYYRTGFGGRVSVCNCLEDGCNEASRTASTLLMILTLLFVVKLFHRM